MEGNIQARKQHMLGLATGGGHHVFSEAAVDVSVEITQVGEVQRRAAAQREKKFSEGLFRWLKGLRFILRTVEALEILNGGRT